MVEEKQEKTLEDNTLALKAAIERAHKDFTDSMRTRKRLARNFVDGIVRGFGIAIGSTIVFGIVIYLLGALLLPGAEAWVQERIADFNEQTAQFTR